jgi:hypothetical protein
MLYSCCAVPPIQLARSQLRFLSSSRSPPYHVVLVRLFRLLHADLLQNYLLLFGYIAQLFEHHSQVRAFLLRLALQIAHQTLVSGHVRILEHIRDDGQLLLINSRSIFLQIKSKQSVAIETCVDNAQKLRLPRN